jgi:hypothetical protein
MHCLKSLSFADEDDKIEENNSGKDRLSPGLSLMGKKRFLSER